MTTGTELRAPTLHDEDLLLWSEEQAALLRRRAAARPEAFGGLDVDNLIEEIADLGARDLRAAEAFLRQIFIHLIKAASDPASTSLDHWLDELIGFQISLQRVYWPSMARRIDLQALWQRARKRVRVPLAVHRQAIAASVPADCPFSLDELLSDDFDPVEAVRRLGGSPPI